MTYSQTTTFGVEGKLTLLSTGRLPSSVVTRGYRLITIFGVKEKIRTKTKIDPRFSLDLVRSNGKGKNFSAYYFSLIPEVLFVCNRGVEAIDSFRSIASTRGKGKHPSLATPKVVVCEVITIKSYLDKIRTCFFSPDCYLSVANRGE